ncbi:MAG TPA: nucleotide exchange factor GrpE, partial [Vicinamibacteria bacterium]|nr:nucleotide exchange factor GrpE [Vicinamibacteria bacterium]
MPDTGVSTSASAEEASRPAPAVDRSEQFLQATRLAEARIAEVVAASETIKSENAAFRERLEGQLSERYEQQRERLLMSSMQTLEALDRAIEIARQSDAAEALIAGVMLVRTQLFRILQEEGLERISVLGLPFDPRSAELVRERPVTDSDHDGLVVEELQGGHQLRGHTIRRAKVVVGRYVEEAAAVVPPAPVPMEAAEPVKVEEAAEPVAVSEEPAVLENWAEPTHPGIPASVLMAGVDLPPPALPPPPEAAAPAGHPAAEDVEEDDDGNQTMVLGDGEAVLVRPPPPLPTSMPTPPLRATAGAAAVAAAAEAAPWDSPDVWPSKGQRETQSVPRETRETPVVPSALPPRPPAPPT